MKRLALALASGVAALFAVRCAMAQAVTISVVPDADSFVRSLAPMSNYGAGGALSVSGASATNGLGVQKGLFDTLMRFPATNVVASLDSTFGPGGWIVTRARLVLAEMGAPDNAIFNRGVGSFEITWQAADSWVEGTGKPNAPTSDGVAWNDLSALVNSNADVSLGVFTNTGNDGPEAFVLAPTDSFVADVRQGNELTLRLTAASDAVGFTFNSREFGNTNAQPRLEITALANPRPIIDNVSAADGNILMSFNAATNWTYRLQRSDALNGTNPWTDVLVLPPQSWPTNVTYAEGLTNSRAFFRLLVSQ